jgi:hypothetical protein
MFVLNSNGHYFNVNTDEITVDKLQLVGCRFFDTEAAMHAVVSAETECDIEDLAATTFYIGMSYGDPVLVDDRGFSCPIEEPIEKFIATYEQ